MAYALVSGAEVKGVGNTTFTTGSIDSSGGDLILAIVSTGHATGAVLSDSKSNTWHPLTTQTDGANLDEILYYAWNAIVGSGHTFTVTGSGMFCSLIVQVFSGSKTSGDPLDQQAGASAGSGTSLATGSITPSAANCLIASAGGWATFSQPWTPAIDSGMTILDSQDQIGSVCNASALAYVVQTSAVAINPTWSWTNTSIVGVTIASFLSATVVGSPARLIFQHA
jgi:hypothetical protein